MNRSGTSETLGVHSHASDLPCGTLSHVSAISAQQVLDFLVDAVTPYVGLDELSGMWALGFFGRLCRVVDPSVHGGH